MCIWQGSLMMNPSVLIGSFLMGPPLPFATYLSLNLHSILLIKLKIREQKHTDQRLHAHMEYCSFHVKYEKRHTCMLFIV